MRRALALAALLVLLGSGRSMALSVVQTVAVGAQPFGVANAGGGLLYVANSGGTTVSIVDTATNTVTGSIAVGSGPGEVAADPGAGRAYVGNFNDGTVSVIDTPARSTIATLSPGGLGVAVDPGLSRLYVAVPAQLTIFDTVTLQPVATIPAPSGTSWWAVTVDPVRHLGYLGDLAGHGVTVVDLMANAVVTTIDVGGPVRFALAVDPAAGRLYAATDTAPGLFTVVDTGTNVVSRTVTVGDFPSHIAVSSAARVYATEQGQGGAASLAAVDPTTSTVTHYPINVSSQSGAGKPAGLVLSGPQVYVAMNGSNVLAIMSESAPVVSASISPSAPKTDELLTASVSASDADGDPLTYAYQWTKNGADIAGATTLTLDLSVAGNGDRGDSIAFRVAVSDGTHTTTAISQAVVVTNTAPVGESATITPSSARTSDLLRASATAHDADADAISFLFQWIRNGTDIAGATTSTLDLSVPGNGDRGDAIAVRVTPTDGTASGTPVASSAVVIADSAPAVSVTLDPVPPTTQTVLVATVSASDPDGDSLQFSYVWKVNGVTRQTTMTAAASDSFDLGRPGNGNKGDVVSVDVTATDGSLTAQASASTMIIGGHLH